MAAGLLSRLQYSVVWKADLTFIYSCWYQQLKLVISVIWIAESVHIMDYTRYSSLFDLSCFCITERVCDRLMRSLLGEQRKSSRCLLIDSREASASSVTTVTRPRTDLVVQCRSRTIRAVAVSVPAKYVRARDVSLHSHAVNYMKPGFLRLVLSTISMILTSHGISECTRPICTSFNDCYTYRLSRPKWVSKHVY